MCPHLPAPRAAECNKYWESVGDPFNQENLWRDIMVETELISMATEVASTIRSQIGIISKKHSTHPGTIFHNTIAET